MDITTNDDDFDVSSQTVPESAIEDEDTKNKKYRVFQKACNNFLLLLKLGLSQNELKLYIIFKPITIQLC